MQTRILYFFAAGDVPVCDPKTMYECLVPRSTEYVQNNEATKCHCPRQCRRLSYDYTISQAEISNYNMLFIKDVYQLNFTVDEMRYDTCSVEV